MAFVFNPFTGTFDEVKIPVVDSTSAPTMQGNGDLQTATIASDGRLYFQANGVRYYISGVFASNPLNIKRGQPIGLMGLTYAYDVS